MLNELEYDLDHMDQYDPVVIDPLHELIETVHSHLDLLNPGCANVTRTGIRCSFPLPNTYVPDYPTAPIFKLNVDLQLFRCLLWY